MTVDPHAAPYLTPTHSVKLPPLTIGPAWVGIPFLHYLQENHRFDGFLKE